MIIRSLVLRRGRLALPKPHHPRFRYLSTTQIARSTVFPPTEVRDPNHPVAQDWLFLQHQKERTQNLGSTVEPHYKPHELLSNPPWPKDITLELLMASQAHIGHATSLWNPANAKYIFGIRGDHDPIHIISLDTTAAYLRRACKVVRGVTSRAGLVLFVGTREGQARAVVRAAQLAKGCHLFNKWIPGTITNGQQILGSCRKKVVDEKDQEILGFQDQLAETAVIKPDLVVCLNPQENYILLHECGLHNIPTIGIIDTDANPTWVTYPIPANDDSLRCVQVICGALGRAGQEGQQERLARAAEGIISSVPSHGLQAPKAGQADKEREAAHLELLAAQAAYEEDGEIVQEALPDISQEEAEELGLQDADVEEAELQAADGQAAEDAYDEVFAPDADGEAMQVDSSLRSELPGGPSDQSANQPYTRDRPLSDEELSQAPEQELPDDLKDEDEQGLGRK